MRLIAGTQQLQDGGRKLSFKIQSTHEGFFEFNRNIENPFEKGLIKR